MPDTETFLTLESPGGRFTVELNFLPGGPPEVIIRESFEEGETFVELAVDEIPQVIEALTQIHKRYAPRKRRRGRTL